MQYVSESVIKILPKGLVTIPKKWREELGLDENGLARIRKEGKRLVLEPVSVVGYLLREYSREEIKQFIKEDRITPQLRKKAKKLLSLPR